LWRSNWPENSQLKCHFSNKIQFKPEEFFKWAEVINVQNAEKSAEELQARLAKIPNNLAKPEEPKKLPPRAAIRNLFCSQKIPAVGKQQRVSKVRREKISFANSF